MSDLPPLFREDAKYAPSQTETRNTHVLQGKIPFLRRYNPDQVRGSKMEGTSITVEARAANTQAGLADEDYIEISNDVPFSLTGQFIEIRTTLRSNEEGESPVLSDLAVYTQSLPQREVCDVDENGIIDYRDIIGIYYSFGDTADGPDDPRDWNRNGIIGIIDATGCKWKCTNPYCARWEF